MKNKNLIPVFLLSALMLTACNEVMAKPVDYDNPLIVDTGTDTLASGVPNNIMSIIYDAIKDDGTLARDVLDEVLHQLAISVIGRYKGSTTADPISLSEAASKVDAEETLNDDVKQFLELHKSYWIKDSDGKRKTDELSRKREYRRVKEAYNRIQTRVKETIYDAIAGGSYNDDLSRFSEEKYLMNLISQNARVANPTKAGDVPSTTILHEKVLILPEIEKEQVFDEFVNVELLENEAKGFNYISKDLIPEIYREILVEQYLFDQSYNTIGRAYARDVNVVSLTVNSEYPLLAGNLMNAYIDTYINTTDDTDLANADMELVSKAWKGVGLPATFTVAPTTSEERAANLLVTAGALNKVFDDTTGYTASSHTYWQGTKFGTIIQDLEKITVDPQTDDVEIHNNFTGSGKTTVSVGFAKKVNSVSLEDYTTDGFYVKSGGLSDLYEEIRTRLFNIGVANALDKNVDPYPDRFVEGVYAIPENEGNYVCKINGHYYLKPATSEKVSVEEESTTGYANDFLWFNKSTSTYYLVEVTEAVSSSKLSLTSDKNYEGIYGEVEGWNKIEKISHEVAQVIAENSSYKTLSTQYWLKAASIAYHDETIYDYFEANYPELFEDE